MSSRPSSFSENDPVSVTFGSSIYTEVVAMSKAYQAADGGKEVIRARTVANSYIPQGFTQLPKMTVYTFLVDSAQIEDDLTDAGYYNEDGPQTPLPIFSYKERGTDLRVRTTTIKAPGINPNGMCMIASIEQKKTNLDKPTCEVIVYAYGRPNKGDWQTEQ